MDMALQSVPVPGLNKEKEDRIRTLRPFRIGDVTSRTSPSFMATSSQVTAVFSHTGSLKRETIRAVYPVAVGTMTAVGARCSTVCRTLREMRSTR